MNPRRALLLYLLLPLQLVTATLGFGYFLSQVVLNGLNNDEIEITHGGWLVAQGLMPFRDFWEHHSPHYFYLVSGFARIWHDADFLLPLRLFHLFLAIAAAGGLISALNRDRRSPLRAPEKIFVGAWAISALAALSPFTTVFHLRGEAVSVCLLLCGLACAVRIREQRPRKSWPLSVGLILAAATSSVFSVRSLVLWPWILAWAVWGYGRKRLLGTASAFVILFLGLASLGPGLRWYLEFVPFASSHLRPGVSIAGTFRMFRFQCAYAGVATALASVRVLSGAILRRANVLRCSFFAFLLCVSWIGPLLERRPFCTSLVLVIPLATLYVASEARYWLGRFREEDSRRTWLLPIAALAHSFALILMIQAPPGAWTQRLAYQVRALSGYLRGHSPSKHYASLARTLDFGAKNESITDAIEYRGQACRLLHNETVLLGTYHHPICVRDASYWGYGIFFAVEDSFRTQLWNLMPDETRIPRDLFASRPRVISADWEIFPHLLKAAARAGQTDSLAKFLAENYALEGEIYHRFSGQR